MENSAAPLSRRDVVGEFCRIKKLYFPRWDRAGSWRLRLRRDINGCSGRADSKVRIISVCAPVRREDLSCLLIHEIAHAAGSMRHGKVWQERMLSVAARAASLGEQALASALREEVKGYQEANEVRSGSATDAYARIEDATAENPLATFDSILDMVRRDFGKTRRDFLIAYPRAKHIFQASVKSAKRYEVIREQQLKLIARHQEQAMSGPERQPVLE